MVLFNYATKELTAKVVYYGPGLCGKTTNLQYIHQNLPETVKGKMLSLATKTDRTLFFDFLPLDLGEIRGMKTRVQLYTVPGQVFYNETRKLVLKGVDGVVFVADSQKDMLGPNVESFKNLEENLKGHGLALEDLPHVIQFNKRDLPKLATIDEINAAVNKYNAPFYESVATTGIGVRDTLNAVTKLVLLHLTKRYGTGKTAASKPAAAEQPQPEAVAVAASAASEPESIPVAAATAAVASTAETTGASSATVAVGPAEELPSMSPAQKFGEDELDGLVDEVQSAGGSMEDVASEPPADVDRLAAPSEEIPIEIEDEDEQVVAADSEITLTEAARDDDLFNDPNLEVARLGAGQTREILIPLEVGDEQVGLRRFKLALRLHLDPAD